MGSRMLFTEGSIFRISSSITEASANDTAEVVGGAAVVSGGVRGRGRAARQAGRDAGRSWGVVESDEALAEGACGGCCGLVFRDEQPRTVLIHDCCFVSLITLETVLIKFNFFLRFPLSVSENGEKC